MDKFNITIDDKTIEVEKGVTLLKAAEQNNIHIPSLCYHKELSPYGACRLCVVEITFENWKGRTRVVASCAYPCESGIIVMTNTDRIKRTRKVMIGLLLARENDAPALKQIAEEYGVVENSEDKVARYLYERALNSKQTNCILCGLCGRVCSEVVGRNAINFVNRGPEKIMQTPFKKVSDTCIGCGSCDYVCPTKIIDIQEAD